MWGFLVFFSSLVSVALFLTLISPVTKFSALLFLQAWHLPEGIRTPWKRTDLRPYQLQGTAGCQTPAPSHACGGPTAPREGLARRALDCLRNHLFLRKIINAALLMRKYCKALVHCFLFFKRAHLCPGQHLSRLE